MENLRNSVKYNFYYQIPLTRQESANGKWYLSNPTWLAEHRDEPWTHPEAKDLTIIQVRSYHLYSDPEDYDFPFRHWKTQAIKDSVFWGYNPTFVILDQVQYCYVNMFLPIYQRYLSWGTEDIIGEMFDNLAPRYYKI